MLALLWALFNRADYYRQEARLGLLLVIADFVFLVLGETFIAAQVHTWLHPALSLFGLIWIASTALSIWYFGGRSADIILVAGMVEKPEEKDGELEKYLRETCEPARVILRAVKFVFLFEGLVVCYFMLVPIWHFWSAHFAMMILLTVFIICGNLLGLEWPLVTFRTWSKAIMIALIVCIFISAGYNFFTGKELTKDGVEKGAQSLKWKPSGKSCPQTASAEKTSRTPKTFKSQRYDWSRAQSYPAVEVLPGTEPTKTSIPYNYGDVIKFTKVDTGIIYWGGSLGRTALTQKDEIRHAPSGSGFNGHIWLWPDERLNRPVRVEIQVLSN